MCRRDVRDIDIDIGTMTDDRFEVVAEPTKDSLSSSTSSTGAGVGTSGLSTRGGGGGAI